MRIVSVAYWIVRMPFSEDLLWSSGRRSATTRLITRITTDSGIVGWGETICLLETVRAVFANVVARLAIGYPVSSVERFGRHVLGAGYYHHKRAAVMATCAMEMAMWDALGKSSRLPLHELWGGLWRDEIAASAYLFHPDPRQCADRAAAFRDQGFATFKVKIGFGEALDVLLLEAVRNRIGAAKLRGDVNGAWFPGTARRLLRRLENTDLEYIEQPLPLEDLSGHAALRRALTVPVALDESAYTLEDVSAIVRADAADVVLLDPHEAGGLWQTIKAASVCEAANIPVTLHSGAELGISQAAYVHLAASIPNMSLAIDTERTYLSSDVVRNPVALRDGVFQVPAEPGLGVEVDMQAVERHAVDSIEDAYLDSARPDWFPVKPSY